MTHFDETPETQMPEGTPETPAEETPMAPEGETPAEPTPEAPEQS